MEMIYTAKYLKLYSKIKNKKSKQDTDRVINTIQTAENFTELHKLLDIKKYIIDGTYRIRYSNNPEFRIRFDLLDKKDNTGKVIELLLVMSREDYGDWDTKAIKESINESKNNGKIMMISESQFKRIFQK